MHQHTTSSLAIRNVICHLVKVLGEIHRGQVILLDVAIRELIRKCRGRFLRMSSKIQTHSEIIREQR